MSITVTCDYCGEAIDPEIAQAVTIRAEGDKGGPKRGRWRSGYIAHYHGDPCWGAVMAGILELHRASAQDELERIPVATPEQLAGLRPGDHGTDPLDFEPLFGFGEPGFDGSPRPRLLDRWAEAGLYFPNDHAVYKAGIATLGDLRGECEAARLTRVKMIGELRAEEIAATVARIYNGEPAPVQAVAADADLDSFLATLKPSQRTTLRDRLSRQGIVSLDQLAAMSDDEMMALEGVAWKLRCKIRDFITARDEQRAGRAV